MDCGWYYTINITDIVRGNPKVLCIVHTHSLCPYRLARAQSQTMRIMSVKQKRGVVTVKSATDKSVLYTVRIKTEPTCTCKDFGQGFIKCVCISTYNMIRNVCRLLFFN